MQRPAITAQVMPKPWKSCSRWFISAIASPQNPVQLRWTLYVDPDTWLIRRAEVVEGAVGATVSVQLDFNE
ncbi:MAG TPA: hypothetical protein DDZ84_11965 [Firmicutes bacterium]|nr:hypothetical protein [Bacillota bacterium]